MTRDECMEILGDKEHSLYEELHHTFFTNYWTCRRYYEDLGLYTKGMVLHHKIVGCDNYEEWKIDEIEPMTKSEHSRIHVVVYKQGLGSQEAISKGHAVLKEKYNSGELHPWNYGKTGVQVSPRRGKTGKEFPFLCASKKGKSGGWNRGLSCPKSEEACKSMSKAMIKRTEEGRNDAFLYSCKGRIWVNNGEINKRILPDEDIPEGFVLGKLYCKRRNRSEINNEST